MTPEQKIQVGKYLWKHKVTILVILLLGAVLFYYARNETHKRELAAMESIANVSKDVAKIETRLPEIQKREEEYKVIEKKKSELKQTLKALDREDAELTQRMEEVTNEVQKMDSNDVSRAFAELGFPNTVVRR